MIKRYISVLLGLSLIITLFTFVGLAQEVEPVELIRNGNAEKGTDYWGIFVQPPGQGKLRAEDGQIKYEIIEVGTETWHIQGSYAGLKLIKGRHYRLSFDIRAIVPRGIEVRIQKDASPYTGYIHQNIELTDKMQHFSFEFEMQEETDPVSKLCFNIGKVGDSNTLGPHAIYIDNLSLLALDGPQEDEKEVKKVHVDQLGYRPEDKKLVMVSGQGGSFRVIDVETEEVVYSGKLKSAKPDPASGEIVFYGDFSAIKEPGTYYISVPYFGESYSFEIKEDVYNELQTGLQKMFYYQRCGSRLEEKYAGIWSHEACQTTEATIYNTNQKKEVTGGWHDAGDYGRYVVPAAKAVADLMLAYELLPDKVASDNIGIPESENSIPDILDQVRYELEWLLKMQDKESGGVYHKVTTADFQGNVFPEEITAELILLPISATATGDFAAVMAMAARIYQPIDSVFANQCLKAARKAWQWLENNQEVAGFKNPPGINTGEYGDDEVGDERYWAAAELYRLTGDIKYHNFLKESYNKNKWEGLGWADVGDYANISYLFIEPDKVDQEFYQTLKETFIEQADNLLSKSLEDGYKISLGTDYPWGSNMTVANNAMVLLIGNLLNEKPEYVEAALDHVHYLVGRNSLSQSYVTGYGDNPARHPHHRLSAAAGETVPGMVAGGPNKNLQDPLAKSLLQGNPPAKCYVDAEPSYSTNEITIYWNSPALFVVSYFTE